MHLSFYNICSFYLQSIAVEQCMQWFTAVKWTLQSFHCTSTALSLQRFAVYNSSTSYQLCCTLHCKQFPCKFCKFPLCPKSHCIFNAIFAVIHCKQWITALNLGAFFEQQFLLNVVCIFCHLELAFSAILTCMVYNLKVLNFAV